jgi:hypothetical protein
MFLELDEIAREIYLKYRYALIYIGVDLAREDIQEAFVNCAFGMEAALQAVITYWQYKQQNQEVFYANAALIESLNEHWQPFDWQDRYLDDPRFQSPCLLWWEEAGKRWGIEERNQLIADVNQTDLGDEYILLRSGAKVSLAIARSKGWEWLEELVQSRSAEV